MTALVSALAGWLFFVALAGAAGAVVGRVALLPAVEPDANGAEHDDAGRLRRLAVGSGFLALVGLAAILARQLREFRDPFAPLTEDLSLLLNGTAWGSAWWLALGSAVVLVVAAMWAGGTGSRSWWIVGLATGALASFPPRTGHAAAIDSYRSLAQAADGIHVLAAGAWVGGLFALLLLAHRRMAAADPSVVRLVDAFSSLARVCVALILVTGLYASWLHVPGPGALVTTTYGRVLLLKAGLVVVVLGLGWWNWKRVTPGLPAEAAIADLRRYAGRELGVGQAVLLVTAFLVRLSPSP